MQNGSNGDADLKGKNLLEEIFKEMHPPVARIFFFSPMKMEAFVPFSPHKAGGEGREEEESLDCQRGNLKKATATHVLLTEPELEKWKLFPHRKKLKRFILYPVTQLKQ